MRLLALKHATFYSTSSGYMTTIVPGLPGGYARPRRWRIPSMTAQASDSRILWFGNNLMTIRVAASSSGDQISIIECRMPQAVSTPVHIGLSDDEIIHVLQGTLRVRVDGKVFYARTGQTVLAPRGKPHTFAFDAPDGATCLIVTQGDEFEEMVRQMSLTAPAEDAPDMASHFDVSANNNAQIDGGLLP